MNEEIEIIDPRVETLAYFEQHKILQIFEYLGSKLASERPSDPNSFLVTEISKILAARTRNQKITVFNEKDIISLFSVFDLTNRGYLSKDQFLRGKILFHISRNNVTSHTPFSSGVRRCYDTQG